MSHNRKTCPECQFETSMDEVHIIGENHTRSCSQYGRGEACPSISETFEGDNSSLKKTFEEAARHDPENKACAQAGYGDNYHGLGKIDCTCPAQKEEWVEEFKEQFDPKHPKGPIWHDYDDYLLCIDFIASQISLAEARGREAGMEKAREIVTNMENPYDIDSHLTFFQGWDQCNADVRLAIIQELNNYVPR